MAKKAKLYPLGHFCWWYLQCQNIYILVVVKQISEFSLSEVYRDLFYQQYENVTLSQLVQVSHINHLKWFDNFNNSVIICIL